MAPSLAVCHLCPWERWWPTEYAAQSAAMWHTYVVHPDTWEATIGDRPPDGPSPIVLRAMN